MANTLVAQGTMNRLVTSIIWADHSEMNVTAPYLGKEGVNITFEGNVTDTIPSMTGFVTSPAPYQTCSFTFNLLRTQSLANQFKNLIEDNSLMGDCTLKTDTPTFDTYQFTNTCIRSVRDITLTGMDPKYVVTVAGIYIINNSLYPG